MSSPSPHDYFGDSSCRRSKFPVPSDMSETTPLVVIGGAYLSMNQFEIVAFPTSPAAVYRDRKDGRINLLDHAMRLLLQS